MNLPAAFEALAPDARRLWTAGLVTGLYALFCLAIALRRRSRARAALRETQALSAGTGAPILVVHASQTGFAEELALATAKLLGDAGARVTLKSLADVTPADLQTAGRALFVVSTTGEGDAPDTARRFIRDVMGRDVMGRDVMSGAPELHGLSHGVLALGDSGYAHFCAFGRTLDGWLARNGATPMFDRVEVDDGDPAALRHWQGQVGVLAGVTDAPDWSRPRYGRWRLAERRQLNVGGPGDAAFHIRLEPLDAATWEAGDILEVGPRNAPAEVATLLERLALDGSASVVGEETTTLAEALSWRRLPHDDTDLGTTTLAPTAQDLVDALPALPHREYSIASLPADGGVELLVRAMTRTDGKLGLGSGWLTTHAADGAEIAARVRTNRSFHAPPDDRPLILIGNGTGLAGLRAHLKARAAAGRHRNWLVFGERTAAHDYFHQAEIEAWVASGVLQRLDLAFSRDQARKVYIQHRLMDAAETLRAWVADGAALYVCGSLEGMSGDVHAALTAVLGAATMERLADEGRYRRDVY